MLYNHFVVCIMTCAVFALLHMISNQNWQYIILPIGILLWGVFKFFNDNDKEYNRRNGIEVDNYDPLFGDLFDTNPDYTSYHNHHRTTNNATRVNGNTITWNRGSTNWDSAQYKGMVNKLKRNFKITLEKNE